MGVSPHQIYTYWKGRVALYAALKAMGIGSGDEVILPGFTCVVVPNAVFYTGATPIYVDIQKESLCVTLETIKNAISPKTKVILIQNMLGLSFHVDEIVTWAKTKGIYTIEDCTHGFGSKTNGKWNGLISDVSFFSTQWNKPFSTGVGGFLLVNNLQLSEPIQKINEKLIAPSIKENLVLWALLFFRKHVMRDFLYWPLLHLYRLLSRWGWVIGSSSSSELTGIQMPKDYFKKASVVQEKQGQKALLNFTNQLEQRNINGFIIHNWLIENKKTYVSPKVVNDHGFLKYPILVQNRSAFMKLAEKHKISIGDWFNSPIHPVQDDWKVWGIYKNKLPIAIEISAHIVNLPTERINSKRLIKFLELYQQEII